MIRHIFLGAVRDGVSDQQLDDLIQHLAIIQRLSSRLIAPESRAMVQLEVALASPSSRPAGAGGR